MTNNQSTKKTQSYVSYFLPGILAGSLYPPSAKAIKADRKLFESGYVEKMDTSQYSVNPVTGVITLYQEPSDYDFIAVSYRTPDRLQYGEQVGSDDRLI